MPGDPDLGSLRTALRSRWWLPVSGIVIGVVLGAALVAARSTTYDAYVLVAPGDVFSPSGAPILDYGSSPAGIHDLVTSPAALSAASSRAGLRVNQLRGHVTTQSLATGLGNVAGRGTNLVKVDVRLANPGEAMTAADVLGGFAVKGITSAYLLRSVNLYARGIASYEAQLQSLRPLISQLNSALARPGYGEVTRILLANEAGSSAVRQDSLSANLAAARLQLLLARSSELPQLIGRAQAFKVTGFSARNAGSIGGFTGLLLGALAAIARRRSRPRIEDVPAV